jgi:hypothetical protein
LSLIKKKPLSRYYFRHHNDNKNDLAKQMGKNHYSNGEWFQLKGSTTVFYVSRNLTSASKGNILISKGTLTKNKDVYLKEGKAYIFIVNNKNDLEYLNVRFENTRINANMSKRLMEDAVAGSKIDKAFISSIQECTGFGPDNLVKLSGDVHNKEQAVELIKSIKDSFRED